MADEIEKFITEAKKVFPKKAKPEDGDPIVYWVATPMHKNYNFVLRAQIAKFNNCMDSVLKLHDSMRIIKLKEWDSENNNLVGRNGRISHYGLDCFWESLDSSVRFNFHKCMEYQAKATVFKLQAQQKAQLKRGEQNLQQGNQDLMITFFKTHQFQGKKFKNTGPWSKSGFGREDSRRVDNRAQSSSNGRFLLPRLQF